MRNLQQLFVLCTASQIIGGDFATFCGLLRIYEQRCCQMDTLILRPHKTFGHITTSFSFFLVDRSTVVTLHFQLFFLENSGHKKRDRNSTYQSLGICIIKAATVRTKTLSQVNVIKSVSRHVRLQIYSKNTG